MNFFSSARCLSPSLSLLVFGFTTPHPHHLRFNLITIIINFSSSWTPHQLRQPSLLPTFLGSLSGDYTIVPALGDRKPAAPCSLRIAEITFIGTPVPLGRSIMKQPLLPMKSSNQPLPYCDHPHRRLQRETGAPISHQPFFAVSISAVSLLL